MSPRVQVMHVLDTLDAGGMERVAVNLVNALPSRRFGRHLCTTRREGALAELVDPDVARLRLARRGRLDHRAGRRFRAYLRQWDVDIVHAHGPSLFFVVASVWGRGRPSIVWHSHSSFREERRAGLLYRLALRRVQGVVGVTERLAARAQDVHHVDSDRVWYLPNFVTPGPLPTALPELPGAPGSRVVCVANLRPEKDHPTLIEAFAHVCEARPGTHLLLVGAAPSEASRTRVMDLVARLGLSAHVTWLGVRDDVSSLLQACDVGVLSSTSEGFPLALAEYGMAGLPAVSTDVGQCSDILERGRVGRLVPPRDARALAQAIVWSLDPGNGGALGRSFQESVRRRFGPQAVLGRLSDIYDAVMSAGVPAAARG